MTGDRTGFVHEALLSVPVDFDERAPGGAVTVALCGAFDHDPPCPLAPHRTITQVNGTRAAVRVVFACLPRDERVFRQRIESAMTAGEFRHDGNRTTWNLVAAHRSQLSPEDQALAMRLAAT